MSSTPTPTSALAASTFDQSIGVNVHMGYTWTPYANVTAVESDLAYIGVNHVRDELLDWSNVQTNYQQLAASGIKFDFLIPTYSGSPNTVNIPEFVGMVDAFIKANPGSVTAIEGPNEVNIWSASYNGGTTLADQALLQKALYTAVHADPNLNGIPVYNLSMAYTDASQYAQIGNLSTSANYANSHAYLNDAQTPQYSMSVIIPYAQLDAQGLPTVITETGYETNPADTYSGVDQLVQAKLTLDTLMDAFVDGVSQTYLYELIDEGGQDFGLFNADGTPKLAATALHNLTSILSDSGSTSSFTPGSLSYAVPNLPTNGHQFLLEKSTGTFDLVLWAEASIWNPTTESEITAPSEVTTVNFGALEKTVLVFDPLQGTAPIAAYLNTQSIQVTLSDHPLIVEVPSVTATLATPTIAGFSPSSGSATSGTLTGTAVANSTVLLFDGNTEIGTTTTNASGAWSFNTGTLASGTNAITSMAVDSTGDVSALSATLNVTPGVQAAAPAIVPAVTSVTTSGPGITNGNGDLNAGHTVTLTLAMSEAVTVAGGTPTLTLNDGGIATYTSGSGSNTLTFSYTVAAGQNTPDLTATAVNLNGASITDSTGHNASLTGTFTPPGTLQIDTIAPAAPVITGDVTTNTNQITLNGTAVSNTTVTVFEGSTQLGTAAVNASGVWSFTTDPLANGAHTFIAFDTDAAGNTSSASLPLDPTIGSAASSATVTNNTNLVVTTQQSVAASSLFTISNPNGDSIAQYSIEDTGGGSGHFTLNGVAQTNGSAFTVSASSLSSVLYVGGTSAGTDTLTVDAYDATTGAWMPAVSLNAVTTASPSLASSTDLTQAVYIGYFGRAGEPSGDSYWLSQLNSGTISVSGMAASFASQPEATALYPLLGSSLTASQSQIASFVNSVYQDLFNRPADSTGLVYWDNYLASNLQNPQAVGTFILSVISGAQNADQATIANKVTVADYFSQELTAGGIGLTPSASALAHSAIASVTSVSSTVLAAESAINTWLSAQPSTAVGLLGTLHAEALSSVS